MRISEAAQKSGLSPDTIRFYEKAGIIHQVERGSDGLRRFSPENVDWLTLLYWLRRTGMPMKEMRRFADLYRQGDATISERRQVLEAHGRELEKRRAELDSCAKVLARKLAIYDQYEGIAQ